MKLLSFTILALTSISVHSVEFSSCIDKNGKSHFTNLPDSSLNSNCELKEDRYLTMLNQDYQNLHNEFKKYEPVEEEVELEESFIENLDDLSINSITNPVKDLLDPDKALEQLIQASEDRDDPFTRAMRSRSNAVDSIIKQGK